MQILNIDNLAQVRRQLQFRGKTHDVVETTVQQFIDNLKAAEALEKAGKSEPEALSRQVENSVDAILESVPTMDRAELLGLKIEAITAILKFIRGELDGDAKSAPDKEGDTEKKT